MPMPTGAPTTCQTSMRPPLDASIRALIPVADNNFPVFFLFCSTQITQQLRTQEGAGSKNSALFISARREWWAGRAVQGKHMWRTSEAMLRTTDAGPEQEEDARKEKKKKKQQVQGEESM